MQRPIAMHRKTEHRPLRTRPPVGGVGQRVGGAVIIMVVSLMTTLVVLGLFFYNWTNQERINAEYFAAKDPFELDPDPIFDFGLQQVLVSTDPSLENSALYGNRWSILAHIMGPINGDGSPMNAHPYSGQGITVDVNGNTSFDLDYNGDGTADRNQGNFILNFSPLANSGNDLLDVSTSIGGTNNNLMFNPAAGYTYGDINSLFLAHDYVDPVSGALIIKPSFALPGYFPNLRTGNGYTGSGFSNWYRTGNANQVLRPHDDLSDRYQTSQQTAQSGDRNRIIEPFPFTVGNLGIWSGSGLDYDWDFDADADGITDSILMDLDHPLMTFKGGRQVVPTYSFKIVDLDGLLNLNAHGNMTAFSQASRAMNPAASIFEDIAQPNRFVHFSNFGLSPAEVNPLIAMFADPDDANFLQQDSNLKNTIFTPHRGLAAERHDGMNVINPPNERLNASMRDRLRIANLEFAMLLMGQPNFNPDDLSYAASSATDRLNQTVFGRYGRDGGQLLTGLSREGAGSANRERFSAPGAVNSDDDDDSNGSAEPAGGLAHTEADMQNLLIPPFVHPLDFGGSGNHGTNLTSPNNTTSLIERTASGTAGTRLLNTGGLANNPMRWPDYPDGGTWQNQGVGNANHLTYRDAIDDSTSPLQPRAIDALVDEEDERVLDSTFAEVFDARFSPAEIAALQLSDADWSRARLFSRVRALAPFNFELNRQAELIRSQFTTESWDRLQFAFSEYAAGNPRSWEFNDNVDGDNRFPPKFNGADASRHAIGDWVDNDPFRPEIRRLLTIRDTGWANQTRLLPQRRLPLNMILADDSEMGGEEAFDDNGNPQFRHLVPHAVDIAGASGTLPSPNYLATTPLPHRNDFNSGSPPQTVPFNQIGTNKTAQEWWARFDRQRLARDIYVLLYTLAGHDGSGTNVDPPQGSSPVQVAIDSDMAREMAQFAVNYVDAMDRDDVITEFVYDPDLSNGWDDPPSESVFGIEAHQLSFSEVMLVETAILQNDSPRTLHDDSDTNGYRFLYIELRNASPFPIELDDETWRIERIPLSGTAVRDQAITFNADSSNSVQVIGPGENFLIACHDGAVKNGSGQSIGSELYVNIDTDQNNDPLQLIYPRSDAAATVADNNAQPASVIDFDLTPAPGSTNTNFFSWEGKEMASGFNGSNSFVEPSPGNGNAGPDFTLLLQRRRNLRGDGAGEDEWIEVDRINVVLADHISDTGTDNENDSNQFLGAIAGSMAAPTQNQLRDSLNGLFSRERKNPFSRDIGQHPRNDQRNHTLFATSHSTPDAKNERSPNAIQLWQPHFDRDFASVIDLLSIPLYGYLQVPETGTRPSYDRATNGGVVGNLTNNAGDFLDPANVAQARFRDPAERWYRLLNFVELPSRADDAVASQRSLERRVPGKINLNAIRHEHVLAGLIDDTVHHDPLSNAPTEDVLESARDWIAEFLEARDGTNPFNGNAEPPGTFQATPFRPLGYIPPNNSSDVENILRTNPNNAPMGLTDYGLFEAREVSDRSTHNVDYHTRNRLLAKVHNNSTTRSHVFAIWVGVRFHEAHDDGGDVKLGAIADDLPVYRHFCVVDMSRLEEAYDPMTDTFDFRKFIIHRQQLP